MNIRAELIRASSPDALEMLIHRQLEAGWDLYGPLITSHKFDLAQWVVEVKPELDFRLVTALSFFELRSNVLALNGEGWDFFQGTTHWKGKFLQWMCRNKTTEAGWVTTMASAALVEDE